MKASLFGIAAIALGGAVLGTPASALPLAGGVAPSNGIEQARIVERVVRGPRCRTVMTKRRGPFGRVVVTRRRECF